jgi:hypothetical protein
VSSIIPDELVAVCCPKDASGNGACRNANSKTHVRRKFVGIGISESKNIRAREEALRRGIIREIRSGECAAGTTFFFQTVAGSARTTLRDHEETRRVWSK